MKVRVDGFRCGIAYLLDCSACGPLGVSDNYTFAVCEVRVHLNAHGVTEIRSIGTT